MSTEKKSSGRGRTRNFATVIYPESAPENWQDILVEQFVPAFISPLHTLPCPLPSCVSGPLSLRHHPSHPQATPTPTPTAAPYTPHAYPHAHPACTPRTHTSGPQTHTHPPSWFATRPHTRHTAHHTIHTRTALSLARL